MRDTLESWITLEAAGEPIEGVVIGDDFELDIHPKCPVNKLLTWQEAAPWLQYEFYSGFGSAGCHALYAWTPNKIIFVGEYDGATHIQSIPRNPTSCKPQYA